MRIPKSLSYSALSLLMNKPQPTHCEKCGKKKVRRVILKPPATYNNYSPMHPRKRRGSGIGRKGS